MYVLGLHHSSAYNALPLQSRPCTIIMCAMTLVHSAGSLLAPMQIIYVSADCQPPSSL